MTLTRPCTEDEFREYYTYQGWEVTEEDNWLVAVSIADEQIETWSHFEGFQAGMKYMATAMAEPIVRWYENLPPEIRLRIEQFGNTPARRITDLPKGKRHRASRYR